MILVIDGIDSRATERLCLSLDSLRSSQREFVEGSMSIRSQAMRVAQLFAVATILEIRVCEVGISHEPSGKPILEDAAEHMSVSHARMSLAVMIETSPVGVDIEHVRARDDGVIRRLFASCEATNIVDDDSFTHAWVKKEAYAKWTGRGLHESLADGVYATKVGSVNLDGLYLGFAGVESPEVVRVSVDDMLDRHGAGAIRQQCPTS